MAGKRILGLDGMRGVAASAVVASHYALPGTPMGRVSVAAFFTLSGYLLVGQIHRLRQSVEDGRTEALAAFASFWASRILRLVPVYLIVLAILYAVERKHGYIYLRESLEWYLLSLQNFYVAFVQPYWLSYSHTWAIAVQNQFYMLVCLPLLFLVPSRSHAAFFEATLFACLGIQACMVWNGLDPQATRLMPQWAGTFMCLGGILALRGAPAPSPMLRNAAILSVFGIAVLCLRQPLYHIVDGVFYLVVLAFFMYAMVAYVLANQGSLAVKVLETRVATHLGMISYELYLVHVPVGLFGAKAINVFVDEMDLPGWALDKTLQFMTIYLVSVLIATILHLGIQVSIDERRPAIVARLTALVNGWVRPAGAVTRDNGTAAR